ncbi:L,D-transpeptidase [Roseibium suaedae]|uniref:Lipoprotein-anchoring transpeptidase ErfK/SrfK n=1 Tax=Roseibium suaedae TaxID=735517 RepID=A0A1M7CRJ9_9HYPH|nr:L,D-transpeptidase [Roseibium suaedae]SHL69856.1 Lipoprotein-anchoring transpeptidase ErfK/SrfK [Roseibium suaedae]
MRKGLVAAAILALAALTATASANPGGQFFDPNTKKWVDFGPAYGGKSPIKRQTVRYDGPYSAGTIIVDTTERRLYHVLPGGKAMKYGIGVGKEGFQWAGSNRISRKAEWPGWTPPPQMRARERAKGRILPAHMVGGPNNPLGARAMYIGSTLYRIHGTNQPWTIGSAVSSGCIRLANDDVIHLYNHVQVGSKIIVKR